MYDYIENEPQPEDYIITPCGSLGSRLSVSVVEGKHLGTFDEQDEAEQFIRQQMERDQFWPGVWFVSDHGNAHAIAI